MLRHSVCYNSCSAFGLASDTLPLPNHSFELYLSQYSSNNPQAAIKRSSLHENLLICFTGFVSSGAYWLAMDAYTHGEGPLGMNNEETNPDDEGLDELYNESHEEGEIDPLDFQLPSEGDVLMEDVPSLNPMGQDDWMMTVLIAAKGNEYSGEDVGDFSERSQLVDIFKYLVNETIQMSHVLVEQHG
jgi:hypothetical protein